MVLLKFNKHVGFLTNLLPVGQQEMRSRKLEASSNTVEVLGERPVENLPGTRTIQDYNHPGPFSHFLVPLWPTETHDSLRCVMFCYFAGFGHVIYNKQLGDTQLEAGEKLWDGRGLTFCWTEEKLGQDVGKATFGCWDLGCCFGRLGFLIGILLAIWQQHSGEVPAGSSGLQNNYVHFISYAQTLLSGGSFSPRQWDFIVTCSVTGPVSLDCSFLVSSTEGKIAGYGPQFSPFIPRKTLGWAEVWAKCLYGRVWPWISLCMFRTQQGPQPAGKRTWAHSVVKTGRLYSSASN